METWRKRPPAAFNLGGTLAERSWNVLFRAESSKTTNQHPPFSIRRFYTNQQRV